MKATRTALTGAAIVVAPFLFAEVPQEALDAQIVILGEFHDNPDHHRVQAEWIAAIHPKAVVFEMLTPGEADVLNGLERNEKALADAVTEFHWSGIADYVPVMLASDALLVGAAEPREAVRASFADGAASVFGAGAEGYGLNKALPEGELKARMEGQFAAHCEAMPMDMMGGMVEAQRYRDASFTRTTLETLRIHGSPVVLVTGNGHARRDWGVPVYLERAAPRTSVFVVGQSETGTELAGVYDLVLNAAPAKRDDPCLAFQ